MVQVDHSLTDRQRLSVRYFVVRFDRTPYIMPNNVLYGWDGQWGYSQAISVNHTYSISPRWLHNVTFSYAFAAPTRAQAGEPKISLSALGSRMKTPPEANLLVVAISGWSGMGFGSQADTLSRSMHFADNASYATGRHNLRFGGETRRYKTVRQRLLSVRRRREFYRAASERPRQAERRERLRRVFARRHGELVAELGPIEPAVWSIGITPRSSKTTSASPTS